MPDKMEHSYGFSCDGPGRGGTCDISAWDSFYLATFWMLNRCYKLIILKLFILSCYLVFPNNNVLRTLLWGKTKLYFWELIGH